MTEYALWKSRSSLLAYADTFILSAIALVTIYKLEHVIYPGTYHPGLLTFMFDYLMITPFEHWPFQNSKFVAILILHCCSFVVMMHIAYRLLQVTLSEYIISKDKIYTRELYYNGLVIHEIDCSRIVDLALVRPLPNALLGVSNIQLFLMDYDSPSIELKGLLRGKRVFKLLSAHIHQCRQAAPEYRPSLAALAALA